jgi:hypothetical protein
MPIHLRQVLAEMDTYENNGEERKFSLLYCQKDGTLLHIKQASKGWKSGKEGGKSNFNYNLKAKGARLIFDHDAQHPRTIIIDGIMEFNGLKVLE